MKVYATEHQFQADCVMWFHNEYPKHRKMLHCNDNNSYNKIEGNKKKALGVVAGVSDLELILYAGVVMFIELKLPGKLQSIEQIDFMNMVTDRGHMYCVIDNIEAFKSLIKSML